MILRATRPLGALFVLAMGAIHLQQYLGADYRAIPTIGTLFLLNAVSCAILGVGLLAPIERLMGRRSQLTVGLLSAAAVAVSLGALVGIFLSENGTLFGFSEHGYRPVIVLAIVVEVAAIACLAPLAAVILRTASHSARGWADSGPGRARSWPRQHPSR